jgi:malonyl-ACP decarboxylase
MSDPKITGLGVTTAAGQGKAGFAQAMRTGAHAFDFMKRPGRQSGDSRFIGAEIDGVTLPPAVDPKLARGLSWASRVVLATLAEAFEEAGLADVDPVRIGLIVGGSNFQQRDLSLMRERFRDTPQFIRPSYGMMFLDTDIVGLCTQVFGIRGTSFTLGAASASGQVAAIQAAEAVQSGCLDVCIAVGAPMDLSHWECRGLRSIGAMGSDVFAEAPADACRPFDSDHDGFIYGEACAALVIERADLRPRQRAYADLTGWGIVHDGNRNPDASAVGEGRAMAAALARAGMEAAQIDYVNTHGSGSRLGDETELAALRGTGLEGAWLNATKSITGHGLTAAGAVEIAAVCLQFEGGFLHATRNLSSPIEPGFNWVTGAGVEQRIAAALSLSVGFGGVNSALCLRNSLN